jgi:predicted Zn-dependent protease with MMP-like domain
MGLPRRRDRHGRGLRGRLLPPRAVWPDGSVDLPAWRSRADVFDDLVLEAVARVARHRAELVDLEVVVHDVPPPGLEGADGLVADGTAGGEVPLALALAADAASTPRIVVYRRPIELRAEDQQDLQDLLHEVVVDAVAELLGVDPDDIDPDQG